MRPSLTFNQWAGVATLALLSVLLLVCANGNQFAGSAAAGGFLIALWSLSPSAPRSQLIPIGVVLTLVFLPLGAANQFIATITPHTIDPILYKSGFGFSTRAWLWTKAHRPLYGFLAVIYLSLPLFAAFVLCISPRRRDCAWAAIIAIFFAPFFYYFFPAVGPAHIGQPLAARNCMPSLHLTWALILAIYCGRRWRWLAVVFAALIAWSTIGLGEHYVIDLIAAIPYTLAVCWLQARFLPGRKPAPVTASCQPPDPIHLNPSLPSADFATRRGN